MALSTLHFAALKSILAMVGALWLGLTCANAEERNTIALLIGVSDYDNEIGLSDLRGPANDVRLMRDVLSERGVGDIRVLADGVEHEGQAAPLPTRAAILGAIEQIARDADDDTLVIITMSGHGTQQRDISGDEADGRDEVFLPADTARSEPGSGVIPNAIIDDELGDAVRAIRRKGADVWLVVDSCHSGSALRAGGTRTAARFVDPNQLGVSLRGQLDRPSKDPFIAPEDEDVPGGLMAFYSAQSDELAREVDFASDKESGKTNNWYGLFTSRLAMRLRQGG
ncbi:MAG: caspase family protein, partial [Pseudomonadota bacterium]